MHLSGHIMTLTEMNGESDLLEEVKILGADGECYPKMLRFFEQVKIKDFG